MAHVGQDDNMEINSNDDSSETQWQCASLARTLITSSTMRPWADSDTYIRIVEQPHPTVYRFRYKSEGRLAGSIPGINSTDIVKTFPTIEVVNYKGNMEILVSCVTVEEPFLQHPHNLVSRKGAKYGVYIKQLKGPCMQATLNNVGIRCVKKDSITQSLKDRKKINFDLFGGGFDNVDYQFNLSSVRLCFQGRIPIGPKKYHYLLPVISEPITDRKHVYKLEITRLCSCSDKAVGGTGILMFCSPLPSIDVQIRFYEEKDGQVIWEAYAEFKKTDVHLKCGIAFKTPPYRDTNIENPVKVFVQLVRSSIQASTSIQKQPEISEYSEPLPFDYYPDPGRCKRLRVERYTEGIHNWVQNMIDSDGTLMSQAEMQRHREDEHNENMDNQQNKSELPASDNIWRTISDEWMQVCHFIGAATPQQEQTANNSFCQRQSPRQCANKCFFLNPPNIYQSTNEHQENIVQQPEPEPQPQMNQQQINQCHQFSQLQVGSPIGHFMNSLNNLQTANRDGEHLTPGQFPQGQELPQAHRLKQNVLQQAPLSQQHQIFLPFEQPQCHKQITDLEGQCQITGQIQSHARIHKLPEFQIFKNQDQYHQQTQTSFFQQSLPHEHELGLIRNDQSHQYNCQLQHQETQQFQHGIQPTHCPQQIKKPKHYNNLYGSNMSDYKESNKYM